ncbi:MAG: peroxiredoxin [Lentimicrobiaceae bacterium]|jgi:peroxiredoxin (alkyl hydroperoxide reductase subunit C)|nr:peroxiredoxin [Lentimicrobiaceae bacterium]
METQENYPMPRIGDMAPDFKAKTSRGDIQFSEFIKGKWTLLFSHPADFTPVCTTEMSGFALKSKDFEKMNTKLIGLSIDSINSHIAWIEDVREKMGILMDFPIIADIDMKVAKLYGMLQPGESETAAVRAVFFIDPKGKIRLIMYYPLNVGRNMDEIIRALQALQTADEHKVALPLNWHPGDKVIVPAPTTVEALEERLKAKDLEMPTFYLAKKKL